MKRLILILCVVFSCTAYQAKAQWAVIDPTNLVQNIISAVQGSSTAASIIQNVQESVKIYNQGKEYYDKLKSVHDFIKDARKVQQTIAIDRKSTRLNSSH